MSRVVRINLGPFIACEDMEFLWDMSDVLDVQCMWDHGKPIWEIADYVGRDMDEVAILVMCLARMNRIKKRPGGVYGNANVSSAQPVHNCVHNSKFSGVGVVG